MTDVVQEIDVETGLKKAFIKPSENRLYDVDVASYMRENDTISSVDSVTASLLSESGTLLVDTLQTNNVALIQFRAHDGTDDSRHKIEIAFTTAVGDSLEADLVLEVKEDF